ncbi:DUF4416 family protein [bacterium]|nr:DUF4416 family protein [bacterium]
MKPIPPIPVKLFSGILYTDPACLEKAVGILSSSFGPVDFTSRDFPFDRTDYYRSEMGSPIYRRFVSFEPLILPDEIARIKIVCNGIEAELAADGRRRVNLDPGYMDFDKVVLASAKYNGDKIYLRDGIWGDLTLRYTFKHFEPYPWSFPDFKSGAYLEVFGAVRRIYKKQMKQGEIKKELDNQQICD